MNPYFVVDNVYIDGVVTSTGAKPIVSDIQLGSPDQMGPYALVVGMPAAEIPAHLPQNTVVEHTVDTNSTYWLIPQPNGWTVWVRADKVTSTSPPGPLDTMGLAIDFATAKRAGNLDGDC